MATLNYYLMENNVYVEINKTANYELNIYHGMGKYENKNKKFDKKVQRKEIESKKKNIWKFFILYHLKVN